MVNRTLDRAFAAVSDPNRRSMLERLESGPASVTDLAGPLGLTLPGTLKHLRVLEDAGLVRTAKQGRTRVCTLGRSGLDEAADWIEHHRRRWERRIDRLEDYVQARRKGKP